MKSNMVRLVIGISLLMVISVSASLAQTQREEDILSLIKKNATWNYPDFILDKLKSNRIVMLADEGHGIGLYYQTVIEALKDWVNTYEATHLKGQIRDIPQALFLVLEQDSVYDARFRKFFVSGDLGNVVSPRGFWNYQFSNATFEFLTDLRSLRLHIDSLNRGPLKNYPLKFDIFSPEKAIDDPNWTVEKRDNYFTYERDEYSSAKVIKLLEDQPSAHALIYYGSAHLALSLQSKPPEKPIGKGYYLAHYLHNRFQKEGGVYICDQVSMQAPWLDDAFKKIDRPFAIEDSCWQDIAIGLRKTLPSFDGAIFLDATPQPTWHMSRIISETMINLILEQIDENKNTKNEFQRGNLAGWFTYLSTFTDKDYMSTKLDDSLAVETAIKELKRWRQTTKIDVVKDIADLSIWKRLVDRIRNYPDPNSTRYQMVLGDYIGFKVWYQNGASPQARGDAVWKDIERYKKYITIDNLIALLWIGTPEEKEKALVVLKQESGQNFQIPKEWAHWFMRANL